MALREMLCHGSTRRFLEAFKGKHRRFQYTLAVEGLSTLGGEKCLFKARSGGRLSRRGGKDLVSRDARQRQLSISAEAKG